MKGPPYYCGKFMLSKLTLAKKDVRELALVKMYCEQLAKGLNLENGVGWFYREESEKFIVYHLLENGCGGELIKMKIALIQKYPTIT